MRRGCITTAAVTVLVLAGLVAVGDRVAVSVAEGKIAGKLQDSFQLAAKPTVDIEGVPFLTQALNGKYQHVTLALGTVNRYGLSYSASTIDLRDVTASLSAIESGDTRKITVGTATATATVLFSGIQKYAPTGFTVSADGSDLKLIGKVSFYGVVSPVTAVLALSPSGSTIKAKPVSVSAAKLSVPISLIENQLTFKIPMPKLPIVTRVAAVTVTPQGVRVKDIATNVNLAAVSGSGAG
jgi:hypothetical protein